jgi:hypothetical protein
VSNQNQFAHPDIIFRFPNRGQSNHDFVVTFPAPACF